MTTDSFTSAVVHRDDPSLLMIRSRDRASLDSLAKALGHDEGAVYTSLPSDYPFRIVVTKVEYAQWVHDRVVGIDYPNFKSRAAGVRGGRYVDFLHQVWSAGLSLTDRDTRERNDHAWAERDREWP
jgi:hypothetical protein